MVQRRPSRLFDGSRWSAFKLAVAVLGLGLMLETFAAPLAWAARPLKLVVFGDSLTAGLGVAPADAFPLQLQAALRTRGHAVEVINAGVSGDTVATALERFDWAIPEDADTVIVELGANDGLRGIDPAQTRATFARLLDRLKARKIPVLLAGMKAPRNYGTDFATQFDAL